jgi:serine/threonine-protein kinase PpkA
MAYIAWLNDQTLGKGYRLPTEAEWEYAARAGSQSSYFWGDKVDDQACYYANVANDGNNWVNNFPCDDTHKWVSPVATFRPNNWGLNDMLGNLVEWSCSAYKKDYRGSELVCTGESSADRRVIRGGGWNDRSRDLRLATRDWDDPGIRDSDLGFRLAQDL